jgi:DHA2 family multidrug resistance protein-like MFS transporter
VAIGGSVMSSAYGSHLVTTLRGLGAPAGATSLAQHSVVAGMRVAAALPPVVRDAAAGGVRQAFVAGLHSGSLVAAGATAVAAIATLAFLPARVRRPAAA